MQYPKDLEENLNLRFRIHELCSKNQTDRDNYVAICKKDQLYFFNTALWTYDPRSEGKDMPFITYPFQDEWILWALERIKKQEDFLTDKSRDMGVSWMIIGIFIHMWLFEPGFTALVGSYIEDYIDNKTIDSHFGRFRYMVERLPEWFYPQNKQTNVYMKLENPLNGNIIVGHAPTANFSRQGRYMAAWADEFAFWQWGRTAWTAMGDATKCRIATSTPNGKGNKFAELSLKSNIAKRTLHWHLHPLKTQEWYENECKRRTPEEIAQELDINYNKSLIGRVYPEFCERNYLAKQTYNPLQPLFIAWDFGLGDQTALVWLQINKVDNTVRVIDAYQNTGKTIDFYTPFITGEMISIKQYPYTDHEREMIRCHASWQPAIHYGDPTGEDRHQTSGTSIIEQLKKYGIYINVNWKKFDLITRIQTTKLLIRRLVVDKDLTEFIDALENSRFPQRAETSQSTSPILKPIHDYTSHFRTALEYFAVNENTKSNRKPTVIDPKREAFEQRLKEIEKNERKKRFSTPSYRTAC